MNENDNITGFAVRRGGVRPIVGGCTANAVADPLADIIQLSRQDRRHLLGLIEEYADEVNVHMQDEQGDNDGRPCESVRRMIYWVLGEPRPERRW